MTKELKEILLYLNNEVEPFPENIASEFAATYKRLLLSIIDISEAANLDKVSEKMYAHFVKLIERFEGIW